jgi:enamine deaminase RidA (YjgF/YER057c/UK114 family)
MPDVDQQLKEVGIILPQVPPPIASYMPAMAAGRLVFVSGQGPFVDGKPVYRGRVGAGVTEEEAKDAARICAINTIATLKHYVGDLAKVRRVVKLLGFVASADDFERQPLVMNGASELLLAAFGPDLGGHARSAIGTSKLPFDIPVEIEVAFELFEEA